MSDRNPSLIFDIGTSEGNDTAFYLAKGFRVVAVEADPVTFEGVAKRFAAEISDGRVTPVHAAASGRAGETVTFYRNDQDQGLSSLRRSTKPHYAERQSEYQVATIDYAALITRADIPHYCKVDIEGGEVPFLSAISPDTAPEFISAEMKDFAVAETLAALGYQKFKLVDQQIVRSFPIPNPPLEGAYVPRPDWTHASGPFGLELPGPWLSFGDLAEAWAMAQRLRGYRTAAWTWYDCHAWKPTL